MRFAAFTIPQKACAGFVMQQKHVVVLANQKKYSIRVEYIQLKKIDILNFWLRK
jgi:hypothetical protein